MKAALFLTVGLSMAFSSSAFGADAAAKKCSAYQEDGTTLIAEFEYQTGKYGECLDKVKKEVATKLCVSGDKFKNYVAIKDGGKPSKSILDCRKFADAGAATMSADATTKPADTTAVAKTDTMAAKTDAVAAPVAGAMSCADEKAFIAAGNPKWCGTFATQVAKLSCDKPNDAKQISGSYEQCKRLSDKFDGDPGDAACKENLPKVKADAEAGCTNAKIIWKMHNNCDTADSRRKITNQGKAGCKK